MLRSRSRITQAISLALLISAAWTHPAMAELERPLPHPVGAPPPPQSPGHGQGGGTPWAALTHQPTFLANGAANPVLMTDGTVLIQDAAFPDWWRLTPDEKGSYVNGTWTQVASLPDGYSPLYHSSAVLPDGRLIIEGGEYLLSADHTQVVPTWTALGAIYDPLADSWTSVAPPPFFTGFGPFKQTIGDAQSVVLPNGTYMQGDCCSKQAALLDAKTLTWTPTGTNKFDENDEEGWTLLPDSTVLTADAYVGVTYDPNGTASEIYNPRTGAWNSAGSTVVQLWDSSAACGGKDHASFELGPSVLRPDGTVFYVGSNQCGAGHTSIYNTRTHKWTAGPDFPIAVSAADGPAALEPNGKVLVMASPGFGPPPSSFFEWDGKHLEQVSGPPNAPNDASFFGNMLVLPTGQILLTDFSNDVEIYTPSARRDDGVEHELREQPFVIFTPLLLRPGSSYRVSGFGFNGISQGAAYGDDVQSATNYPLVRITNLKTGHVFYSRTHDHSSMAVASDDLVHTTYDVPRAQERGLSKLEVVANGTASPPVIVLVE